MICPVVDGSGLDVNRSGTGRIGLLHSRIAIARGSGRTVDCVVFVWSAWWFDT
jgi:hypothetical protein